MKCPKGLHEIDPTDPWYERPWVKHEGRKCRECWNIKHRAVEKGRTAKGLKAATNAIWRDTEKGREARVREAERARRGGPNFPRNRAHHIALGRYGVSLRQIEREGLLDLYPDIRRALDGE